MSQSIQDNADLEQIAKEFSLIKELASDPNLLVQVMERLYENLSPSEVVTLCALPSANNFCATPALDNFWKAQAIKCLGNPNPPLGGSSWFDVFRTCTSIKPKLARILIDPSSWRWEDRLEAHAQYPEVLAQYPEHEQDEEASLKRANFVFWKENGETFFLDMGRNVQSNGPLFVTSVETGENPEAINQVIASWSETEIPKSESLRRTMDILGQIPLTQEGNWEIFTDPNLTEDAQEKIQNLISVSEFY